MSKKKTTYTVLGTAMAFAASLMAAPPAAAAYPVDVQCWGEKVKRCVRLDLSGGVNAVASITDTQSDSENYDVSVSSVTLFQVWPEPQGMTVVGTAAGEAGWQVEWDRAVTGNVSCTSGVKYRVAAIFRWRLAGTTSDYAGSPEERWSATYTCP
ncbi:hypothetical protein ACFCZV_24680 [Streptomyces hydrogenans]|uniref:hypothetical protein n=1 Tax=Streptomyces hydrogenans TaxID=1873719 RepID=UPI0035D6C0FE